MLSQRELRGEAELEPQPAFASVAPEFLETYCLDCHISGAAEADLELDALLESPSVHRHRRDWEKVVGRLLQGEMPPQEAEQPPLEARETFVKSLQTELDSLDCSQPANPGRVTVRRLNRTEYANTIHDWLGIEIDVEETFPRDELGHGFDNNGDVLSLSPLLFEKYLEAAEQIADLAIVTPESIDQPTTEFSDADLEGGSGSGAARTLATDGAVVATFACKSPGRYVFRVEAYATQAGEKLARMDLSAGGILLKSVEVAAEETDPQVYSAVVDLEPGPVELAAAFVNDLWLPLASDRDRRDRNLFIESMAIVGPIDESQPAALPKSQRRLFLQGVTLEQWRSKTEWQSAVRRILRDWTLHAYRRPATEEELDRLVDIVAASRGWGDSFERSMQHALQALLVSSSFLFRGETDPEQSGGVRSLNDFELATRLSYFLWRSLPDDRLLQLAAQGRLKVELDSETARLITDAKSTRMIEDFGEQWLETRNLEELERITDIFPEFDGELRQSLREETLFFVRHMWRENVPLTDLLTADYSFVNPRLAALYGIDPPAESGFHRAVLPANRQIGLLGHGAVLAVTSYADRTSPVIRGKWILERLLNDPPPPPPPDVPELGKASAEAAVGTLRQRLEQHRTDPTCAACHRRMDPLGFAMENFDPIGRWRDEESGAPIDASGELPDGRSFDGPVELRDALVADFDRVRRAIAEQMLTYALGRGLEYYDHCTIDGIVEATVAGCDTFASMARAIIHSPAFLQRNEGQP